MFVMVVLRWFSFAFFSHQSHQNSRSISVSFKFLLPLHFSSSLASHCCCLALIVVVCIALCIYYVNNLRLSFAGLCMATTLRWQSIMQTTESMHARTRSHSMNVKSMKRRIQFIFLFLADNYPFLQHRIETATPATMLLR